MVHSFPAGAVTGRSRTRSYIKRNRGLYFLLIPGIVFILMFHYAPMYGILIAFKDFNIFAADTPMKSLAISPWVGLDYFKLLFGRPEFGKVLANTLVISLTKLILLFPLPIVIAIMLNEIRSLAFKRVLQTVIYLPHFFSWAIIAGIFLSILSANGPVNQAITGLGGERILFFMDKSVFRSVLVFSEGWKETGWSTIVYLAAITGISAELYEAAVVDGAGRWRQTLHITLPGIRDTIVMLLIIRVCYVMDAGFEQIFVMYNPTVYDVADIIGTYVYRVGLGQLNFSFGTAVGLFNSIISFILVVSANTISRRLLGRAIW